MWFLAERDTRTNEVQRVELPGGTTAPTTPPDAPAAPAWRADRPLARVVFSFRGKSVRAYEGDTIGSALFAAGQRVFSRSFKYHRPRGLLCGSGSCANCMMQVDGAPNVRVCAEPARPARWSSRRT